MPRELVFSFIVSVKEKCGADKKCGAENVVLEKCGAEKCGANLVLVQGRGRSGCNGLQCDVKLSPKQRSRVKY